MVIAVPQTGIRMQSSQCLVVADQNADLMALTLYGLRGLPPLEPGVTLELREPQLRRVEVAKTWEAAAPPIGFHLLRLETPATHLRINGHPVQAAARAAAPPRRR